MRSRPLCFIGCFAAMAAVPACGSLISDPSVVVDETFWSERVENGTAYDRGAIDLRAAKRLVLPDNVTVQSPGTAGTVQLFMAKKLNFGGHPPEPMSIRSARKNMGCAVRAEGDALVVATYGEWDSRIEGGASMAVVAVVPAELAVDLRPGLSGPSSSGREWNGRYLTKPKDARGGYWYGPASPAEGWAGVPVVPDSERTFVRLKAPAPTP
ncbi:hypothetical protein R5W24_002756 [Gemmata sp. JC717]|uniref:hypothetical protein n=1 Tax=Gemmata algarum TaxID=2975278 RepID=UPI0021BB9B4B|nr:hypothetical protein [Gemmata algarum]MDY3553652.1 hypothetical protein [Gemmata algarum]